MLVDSEIIKKDVVNILLTKKQQNTARKNSILRCNNKVEGTQNREHRTRSGTRMHKRPSNLGINAQMENSPNKSANNRIEDIKNKYYLLENY